MSVTRNAHLAPVGSKQPQRVPTEKEKMVIAQINKMTSLYDLTDAQLVLELMFESYLKAHQGDFICTKELFLLYKSKEELKRILAFYVREPHNDSLSNRNLIDDLAALGNRFGFQNTIDSLESLFTTHLANCDETGKAVDLWDCYQIKNDLQTLLKLYGETVKN